MAIPTERPGSRARGDGGPSFRASLDRHGGHPLRRQRVTTLQFNVGRRCNQACRHCHVDAGPHRTESMSAEVAARALELLAASPRVEVVDVTGGAPELNPHFRWLVTHARRLARHVIDRCNLTVLFEPGQEDLASFLAHHQVEVIASLPCYSLDNVDRQRGRGVFERSIAALRRLNALGYGRPGSPLRLHLVYNPLGAFLPPRQDELEQAYRRELKERFDLEFHRLYTLTNMPIHRFADQLRRSGGYRDYLQLLADHFNPATLPALMCRSLISVGWDGRLHDCDFNQMLDLSAGAGPGRGSLTVWDIDSFEELAAARIATGPHCFGCTAGAGSSCGGALAEK